MSLSNPKNTTIENEDFEGDLVVNTGSSSTAVATQDNSEAGEGFFRPKDLKDAEGFFARNDFEVEPGMAHPCANVQGKIKIGEDLKGDAGEWIDLMVLDVLNHSKVNLGVSDLSEEHRRLQLNCYDGETVKIPAKDEGSDPVIMDVNEYVESLKKDYPKAYLTPRVRIQGVLVGAEKVERLASVNVVPTDFNDPDSEVALVTIYGSQSSANQWKSFVNKQRWNLKKTLFVRVSAIELSNSQRSWPALGFSKIPNK